MGKTSINRSRQKTPSQRVVAERGARRFRCLDGIEELWPAKDKDSASRKTLTARKVNPTQPCKARRFNAAIKKLLVRNNVFISILARRPNPITAVLSDADDSVGRYGLLG